MFWLSVNEKKNGLHDKKVVDLNTKQKKVQWFINGANNTWNENEQSYFLEQMKYMSFYFLFFPIIRRHRIHSRSCGYTNEIGHRTSASWQIGQSQRCAGLCNAHRRFGWIHRSIDGENFPIGIILHGRKRTQSSWRRSCRCCTHFLAWNSKTLPSKNLSPRCCIDFGMLKNPVLFD